MKRILIADDSPFIRDQLRIQLEQRGAEVYEAKNGKEAVHKGARVHPDLVVLDCQMPEMDGLQAARELHRAMPAVPLVMFVLDNSPYLAEEAQKNGIRALFPKTKFLHLLNWIEKQLQIGPVQAPLRGAA